MRSLLLALAVSLLGCSSSSGSDACTPGAQVACACGGSSTGEQVCNEDGTGYGTCACLVGAGQDGGAGSGGAAGDLATYCPMGTCETAAESIADCPVSNGLPSNTAFTILCGGCKTPDLDHCAAVGDTGEQFCCEP